MSATCRVCEITFSGALTCHCSGCHLTFSGVSTFDAHQKGGKCLTQKQITLQGMSEVRPGILGRPVPTQTPTVARQRGLRGQWM